MRISTFVLVFFLYFSAVCQSQGAFSNMPDSYVEINQLIDKERYEEAKNAFKRKSTDGNYAAIDRDFLESVLHLKIDGDSKNALRFIDTYTSAYHVNELKSRLGEFYFFKREYQNSILWYQQAEYLNHANTRYYADALLALKEKELAAEQYQKLLNSDSRHYAQFQLGTILWEQEKKREAINAFQNAMKDEAFRQPSSLYISIYHFEKQAYDRVLEQMPSNVKSNTAEGLQLLTMKAKSLQELGDYKTSLETYRQLEKYSRVRLSNDVLWNYAHVSMQTLNATKAAELLNILIQNDSKYQQEASFRLGVLQTQSKDFTNAIPSFQLAIQGENEDIRGKALLNMAKAQMEMGLFEQVISALENFRDNYPNSNKKEVAELLTNAHLQSSDFEETLNYIESQEIMSPVIKRVYQLVAFENGSRYFFDQDYGSALKNLINSNKYPINEEVLQKSQFLLAEIYSIQQEYIKAVPLYNLLSSSKDAKRSVLSLYGLGYAYFNTKDYDKALETFELLNEKKETPRELLTEADLRIGDCHYVAKRYDQAIRYYRPLRNSIWAMHAKYQLGQIYTLTGQPEKALELYTSIVNQDSTNSYKAESLSSISQLQLELLEFEESLNSAERFQATFPNHELYEKTLLTKATAATNLQEYDKAETALKSLLNNSENDLIKKNALLALQLLTEKGHSVSDFQEYFDRFSESRQGDPDLLKIAYEAAKAPYFNQDYLQAVTSLNSFQSKYKTQTPNDYHFYLGDAHLRLNNYKLAVKSFDILLMLGAGRLQERVFNKRGEALLQLMDYENALDNYSQWLTSAKNDRENYNARYGMLVCYQNLAKWTKVLELCEQLENASWKPYGSESKLALIKGEALLKQGELSKAADEYIVIMNNQEGEKAAQAYYMFAKTQALDSNYFQSNETLLELISEYASYPEYTQAAYLQLIDNYVSLDNKAQATAIAQSIIENGTDSLFVNKAKQRLATLELELASSQPDSISNK